MELESKTISDPKLLLLSVFSSNVQEIRFYDNSDSRGTLLIGNLIAVAQVDPEFILKLAYYLRNKLLLKTSTNFVLAFAACEKKCKPFLSKYFAKSIVLPTDIIECCQFVQLLRPIVKSQTEVKFDALSQSKLSGVGEQLRKNLKFSKILKVCIAEKFKQFSEYTLGKYCSEARRKATLKKIFATLKPLEFQAKKKKIAEKGKANVIAVEKKKRKAMGRHKKPAASISQKNLFDITFITMKDIILLCHISQPQYFVRSILGIKYPKSEEEFNSVFKDEEREALKIKFDPSKTGKRMKIVTPKTWETELSSAKNEKKESWEELITKNQLPYMATIRNLRNLFKAGVGLDFHTKVAHKLSDEKQVQNSKLFPLNYLSAISEVKSYVSQAITKLDNPEGEIKEMEEEEKKVDEELDLKSKKGNSNEEDKKVDIGPVLYTKEELKQLEALYADAINKALSIAVAKNVEEIPGSTLILCDVSGSMRCPISGGKSYGSVRTCFELALLLGLMIKSKCQNCEFYLFSSPAYGQSDCFRKVELQPGNDILPAMNLLKKESQKLGGGTDFPYNLIFEKIDKNQKLDRIVLLSDMMISNGAGDIVVGDLSANTVLTKYKNTVNPEVKIFSMDLRGYGKELKLSDEFSGKNFIRIFGMSDKVLTFLGNSETSQLEDIEEFAKTI